MGFLLSGLVLVLVLMAGNPFLSRTGAVRPPAGSSGPPGREADPPCPFPEFAAEVSEVRLGEGGVAQWVLRDGRMIRSEGARGDVPAFVLVGLDGSCSPLAGR
ncbi:MAG: hypothetical protein Fur0037_04600 [Planctomycetota bacterium]